MKTECKRCKKIFEKWGRKVKLCEDCWTDARTGLLKHRTRATMMDRLNKLDEKGAQGKLREL